jgi:hypothetical protein
MSHQIGCGNVANTVRQLRSRQVSTSCLVFAILAFASGSAEGSTVTRNCDFGSLQPCYEIDLAPLFGIGDVGSVDAEPTPLIESLSNSDGAFSSARAFGKALFGSLGALSTVTNTGSIPDFGPTTALAEFGDIFTYTGVTTTMIRFTAAVTGTTGTTGDAGNTAGVSGEVSVINTFRVGELPFSADEVMFSGPGTLTVQVVAEPGDQIGMFLDLQSEAETAGFGTATADFSDTLMITSVQAFDLSGRLLGDIALTDREGNVLRSLPATAVPEPSTLSLLALAAIAVALCGGVSGNRISS